MGFGALADFCLENARAAERWLVKAGRAYPHECDAAGRSVVNGVTPHAG